MIHFFTQNGVAKCARGVWGISKFYPNLGSLDSEDCWFDKKKKKTLD